MAMAANATIGALTIISRAPRRTSIDRFASCQDSGTSRSLGTVTASCMAFEYLMLGISQQCLLDGSSHDVEAVDIAEQRTVVRPHVQERNVLAGVIGARCRRIAAVVGSENQLVFGTQAHLESLQHRVELLERSGVSSDVSAMAVFRIEIVKIRKDETVTDRFQQLERFLHRITIVAGADRRRYCAPTVDVANLPYRV